ncbi:MAG: hypothetical protein FWC91_01290 [Defluviitaleaceae bacterium]|nr:hypothetical protein [Defluviitaleaceae bacterium]
MKKIILLAIALCATGLTACNESGTTQQASSQNLIYQVQDTQPTQTQYTTEPIGNVPIIELEEFEIQINFANDDFLRTFDHIHELDYSVVRTARDGSADGLTGGDNLMIWANQPITDFAVLLIVNDIIDEELIFIPLDSFGTLSELNPNEAFVINNYWGLGTLPWSGITFTEESGIKRYFTLQQSMYDGNWRFLEFENRVNELPNDWKPEWYNVLTEQPNISEYGWQIAAEFLSGFTTLFTGVSHAEIIWDEDTHMPVATGRFIPGWDSESQQLLTTYELPEISFAPIAVRSSAFLDRYGNIITNAPWAYIQRFDNYTQEDELTFSYSHHYANHFKLFDFDNSGIPEIFIHFQQTFEGCYGGFYRIFRYTDGAYRMLEMTAFQDGEQLSWVNFGEVHDLFIDADGRIITFVNCMLSGSEYGHLILTDTHAELHIISSPYIWEEWYQHHREVWDQTPYGHERIDSWVFHNPTIFGTDVSISPLHPLTDLGDELLTYLHSKRQI